jgi:predicted enzyme related to lactoylglutathione lyase
MGVHGKWIWYELMSPDPAGSKAFYEAVFDWTLTLGTEPPMFYGHIVRGDGSGSTGGLLPLTDAMTSQGARPAWVGYIAVDDVDAAVTAITARGGTLIMPKMTIEVGSFAMVKDCCGAPFYVMTPNMPAGGQPSRAYSPDGVGSCGWNELYSADPAKAIAFYTEVFGWTLPPPMDMGEMGQYHFMANEDGQFGAAMKTPGGLPASLWNFYFRVADFDAAVAAVSANGGTIRHGPMEVPTGDWVIAGTDPQGAMFHLVGQKKG